MQQAIDAVEINMSEHCQPMRRETKELVKNFNRKCRKAEQQIVDLPEDAQKSAVVLATVAKWSGCSVMDVLSGTT